MNKTNVTKVVQRSVLYLKRRSPTILTCIGTIGVVATAVMAVKATPKALDILEDAKEAKGDELTPIEIVKEVGPVYIPSITMGLATISCIIGANVVNQRRQASLVSACCLTNNAFHEYRDKLREIYGEEADITIKDSIAKDKRKDGIAGYAPGLNSAVQTGEKLLFYESYRGTYFEASMDEVRNAEYHLNRNFALRGYTCLNEFYEFLGLEPTDFGDSLGWNLYGMASECDCFWIDFDHRLVKMEDGTEYYAIEMPFEPCVDQDDED